MNPALSSCDCSCGAALAAQGSPSSTASFRVSGTAKSLCHVPVPTREYPDATMSAEDWVGLGVTGKFTLPPWPTTVVDVEVGVVGVGGVVVGVVEGVA